MKKTWTMVNVMMYQMVLIVGKQPLVVAMAWQMILNGSDKNELLPQMDRVEFGGGAPGQKIIFF